MASENVQMFMSQVSRQLKCATLESLYLALISNCFE